MGRPETIVQPSLVRRAALLERLADLEMEPGVRHTVEAVLPGVSPSAGWEWLPKSARESGSGLYLLSGSVQSLPPRPRLAIAPPFPVVSTGRSSIAEIRAHLLHCRSIGIILLRLGHYAVGVAEDERLLISKTGARYVKNRQRQGGQSANRFVRNREKWIQQLFDEVADVARSRFTEYGRPLDWLALGGDRTVLSQFMKRAALPTDLADRVMPWLLPVERPGRDALGAAVSDAWACRVYDSPAWTA